MLGFGINFGAYNSEVDPQWEVPEGEGFIAATSDPAIPVNQKENSMVFDFGTGIFYRSEAMYIGFSIAHLNQGAFKYSNTNANAHLIRHYFLHGGYNLSLKNPKFIMKPSFWISSDGTANQFVVSSLIEYNEKMWGGVSMRMGSALVAMLGFELFEDVKVGYAFDFETSKIRQYGGNSHEVILRYSFDISVEKLPEGYKSIRYL